MAVREAVRRRWRGARSSRSRTTSDFEIFHPRDSASMSATSGSGNRTVRLFMKWQVCKTNKGKGKAKREVNSLMRKLLQIPYSMLVLSMV